MTAKATSRKRHRWSQFRLSTLMLIVAIVGGWLAIKFQRTPLSTENLAKLQKRERIELDIFRVVWSPGGDRLALVAWEKPVAIHDSVTLWKLDTIGADKKIIHFAFSSDRDTVAFCENGVEAVILDLPTGTTKVLKAVNHQPVVVFSPDGRLLATGGGGDTARLWDVATGNLLHELPVGPTKGGLWPAFSPDGTLLAIGNRNSTTHLFDVASGRELQILPRRMSQELTFHPTRPILAVSYVDASIGLWDVKTGELLHSTETTAEEIYSLDWSPDGEILASAGLRGDINLWSDDDLSLLHTLSAPEWVVSVRFRPDGRGLVTAGGAQRPGGERYVQEWEVPSVVKRLFEGASGAN